MKICFISPFMGPLLYAVPGNAGGAERQFFLFGQELQRRGCPVAYITTRPKDDGSLAEKAANFDIQFADFSWMNGTKLHLIPGFFSLLRAMRRTRADVFIIKTPAILLLPMLTYRFFFGGKMVFWAQTSHDAEKTRKGISWVASLMQNFTLPRADEIIAQTKEQKEKFKQNFGIHAEVIPNIFIPYRSEREKDTDIHGDVFWCGNGSANKRVEVVWKLASLMPDLKFVVAMNIGIRACYEQAEETAKTLSNVHFLGAIPADKIDHFFHCCPIYLNTSLREGFPNTFLQAFAAGRPIVTLSFDPDHIVEKEELGVSLASRSTDMGLYDFDSFANILSDPIRNFLANDLWETYSDRCKAYVSRNHSPERCVKLLQQVLSNSLSPGGKK